nr:hypothetical protein [Paenibacillus maysiensis]
MRGLQSRLRTDGKRRSATRPSGFLIGRFGITAPQMDLGSMSICKWLRTWGSN